MSETKSLIVILDYLIRPIDIFLPDYISVGLNRFKLFLVI